MKTLKTSGLYAIVSPRADVRERVVGLLDAGVARVQVRAKGEVSVDGRPAGAGLNDRALLAVVCDLAALARPYDVAVIVNDRLDIAYAARCTGHDVGVHLGDTDLPPHLARRLLGDDALIGTSTHTAAQLAAMHDEGSACHLALGPIWSSPTKQGHADVTGVDALRAARMKTTKPIVAIGGITSPERAATATAAGADFVAVVSALEGQHDSHDVARAFIAAMSAATQRRNQ